MVSIENDLLDYSPPRNRSVNAWTRDPQATILNPAIY
jgi:hypothetical protein